MKNGTRRERGTGSLRLRGATWWARYYHNGQLVEESTKTGDEKEARKFLRAKVKAADTPQYIEPAARKLTFEELCELVRADYRRRGNRTLDRLGTPEKPGNGPLVHLGQYFGGWQALAITADDVDRYADQRIEAGAKPATANRELAALRRGFRLAVKKQLLPSMPAIELRSEAGNERQGFLDPPDFAALLAELQARNPDLADAVEFAYCTALRRGNVLGCRWSWLALVVDQTGAVTSGRLTVPGTAAKNKKALSLPLASFPQLLAVVARRHRLRDPACPFVFHRDGERFDRIPPGVWHAAARAIGARTYCSMICAGRRPGTSGSSGWTNPPSWPSGAGRPRACSGATPLWTTPT